jgi:hypothetical protein
MTLALAESRLARDGSSVEPVVREAKQALTGALDELRRLTQGLRPAVLIERGLAAALDDLARSSPLVVRSDVQASGTVPKSVEDVAYYVASEALTNAVKHSGAGDVRLGAWRDGATARHSWSRWPTTGQAVRSPVTVRDCTALPTASRHSVGDSRSRARWDAGRRFGRRSRARSSRR